MSFLEISPEMFFALLPLPCLRGLKSLMSMTIAALHRLPAMTNLLLVGTWFSDGFFGDLHRRFLIKSPVLHPPPTLTPKNCTCTCAGCTHQQDIKRGPDCYTPGFLPDLARSSPVSHAGSETSKILHSIDPHCNPAPLLPPCDADNPPSLL